MGVGRQASVCAGKTPSGSLRIPAAFSFAKIQEVIRNQRTSACARCHDRGVWGQRPVTGDGWGRGALAERYRRGALGGGQASQPGLDCNLLLPRLACQEPGFSADCQVRIYTFWTDTSAVKTTWELAQDTLLRVHDASSAGPAGGSARERL